MTKKPTNVGASVRARLLRLARERGEDFQLVLTRYASERLLYRLTSSRHASRFVLKGAALFTLWTGRAHRATRDLDLLGFGDSTEPHVRAVFADVLAGDVCDDGVRFDEDSLEVGPIREEQEYGGVRVVVIARIASAKVRLQVDVGFGDAVTPEAAMVEFPTLLDFPAPRLRAYPRETVVAEKVEAMVQLGLANSRMKDFYDLVIQPGRGHRHDREVHRAAACRGCKREPVLGTLVAGRSLDVGTPEAPPTRPRPAWIGESGGDVAEIPSSVPT